MSKIQEHKSKYDNFSTPNPKAAPMSGCKHDDGPAGYVDWHNWAHEQVEKGRQQTMCLKCGLYKFNFDDQPHPAPAEPEHWQCDVCGESPDLLWTARKQGDPQDGKRFCKRCMAEWNPDAKPIGERQ